MNENFVRITKDNGIFINGTKINRVLNYSLKATPHGKEMTITFDMGDLDMHETPDDTDIKARLTALEERTDKLTTMIYRICHKASQE